MKALIILALAATLAACETPAALDTYIVRDIDCTKLRVDNRWGFYGITVNINDDDAKKICEALLLRDYVKAQELMKGATK